MSHNPILHPTKRHPLTGKRLEAVGVLPSGRIVWPILGGDDTVPPVERPEDIAEDVWDALGDPGKAALVREREARQEAERALAAARAPKPAPPKNPPAPTPPASKAPAAAPTPGDQPDIAAIVQQAVEAAVAPLRQAEEQRQIQAAAQRIADAVVEAAKPILHDATDALANVDLTTVLDNKGQVDPAKVKTALDDLVAKKPHLAKGPRIAPPGIGGGAPAAATDAEKVKAVLADMQRATGLRIPSSNTN